MSDFLNLIKESFMSHGKGFSARKMTAFVVTILIVYTHYKWLKSCYSNNQFDLLPQVLLIDFTALLCLLGLTTWEKVSGIKNTISGSNNSTSSSINVDMSQNNPNLNKKRRNRRRPNKGSNS